MNTQKTKLFDLSQTPPLFKCLSNASTDRKSGFVSLQSESCVDCLSIEQKCFLRPGPDVPVLASSRGYIGSHAWRDGNRSGEEIVSPSIALSHVTGNLSVHQIQGLQSTCTTELHRLTLKSLIKEKGCDVVDLSVAKTQVLNYNADLLTVLVDRQLVVQLRVHETMPWQIVTSIPCPSKILHASVTEQVLSLVDSDHSILLYNLKNGAFLAVIQREKGKYWNSCRLTADYLHMVLQNDSGQLYCCNLDAYFEQNAMLLNRSPCSLRGTGKTHWFHEVALSDTRRISRDRKIHSSKCLYKVPFQGDCLSYECTDEHISAICHYKGAMLLFSYSLASGSTERTEVNSEEFVVLSNTETIPHLLISDNAVHAITVGPFSKVDPASDMWDVVMAKNSWSKRSPSVGLDKLIIALKTRDVNTVLLCIKAESSFIEDVMRSTSADEDTANMEKLCSHIHAAASAYIAHTTTKTFAKQITEATLEFLKEQSRRGLALLNEMLMVDKVEKKALIESLLERISDHIMSFKDIIKSQRKSSSKGKVLPPVLPSALNEDLVIKWNSLSSKELIGDGILMGDISLLQAYFRRNNRSVEASWDFIVKTGLQCVLEELELGNWPTACQMLKNMGFGVFPKLSQIAMYTTDSKLRRYLVAQLQMEGEFSEADQKAIKFGAEMDELFPCESFREAMSARLSGSYGHIPASDVFRLSKLCGEVGVIPSSAEVTSSRWYSHYMLDWLHHWLPHREDIIIGRYIHDTDGSSDDRLSSVSSESVWSHLCRHNLIDQVLHWINVQYAGAGACRPFQNQPINATMVDYCYATLPVSSRLKVSERLSVHGILSSSDSLSAQRKFANLSRSGLILDRSKAERSISLDELISHCLSHGLLEVLFQYFSTWGISELEVKGLASKMPGKDHLLLLMLFSFYQLSLQGPEASLLLDASLASSRYLSRNPYLSRTEHLDKQLTDVAMCDIMYHSPLLEGSKVLLTQEQLAVYREHPLLRHVLESFNDDQSSGVEVINLYVLLQKWGTLRSDRLFAAQMKEVGTKINSPDALPEMAYFANNDLVKRYGVDDRLTFLYYLKQARPTFAFLTFLSDEISICNGSTIPASRVNLAVRQTHYLAIKFYENLEICASCVAFLELIGEDKAKLRLLINATQIIHMGKQLRNSRVDSKALQHQVESLMLPVIFGKKQTIKEAYDELTEAADLCISNQMEPSCRTSVETGLKWRVVVDFSRQYSLAVPTRFLEHCALANNWLSFLVYSQVFKYDRFQLVPVAAKFMDDGIREHLQCVLDCSRHTEDSELSAQTVQQQKRSQLHDKMAAKRPAGNTSLVSSSEDETRKSMKDGLQTSSTAAYPSTSSLSNGSTGVVSVPVEHLPNDIFAILFMASSHSRPWKQLNIYSIVLENPVLAVLAACHKDSEPLDCLGCWLIGSLSEVSKVAVDFAEPQSRRCIRRRVALDVIRRSIDEQQLLLLRTGLRIFVTNCALIHLLDAIEELPRQLFFVVSAKLNQFRVQMNKSIQSNDTREDDFTFQELVSLSLQVIQTCVVRLDSYLCERMLHLLDEANMFTLFKDHHVNFGHAYRVFKVVYNLRLPGVDRSKLLSSHCIDEARNVLSLLEARREFDSARQLAMSCHLDPGLVSVQELISDVELAKAHHSWQKHSSNSKFWQKCHDKCIKYDIDPAQCSEFFERQAVLNSSLEDKVLLNQYALDWMRQVPRALQTKQVDRLQKLVWQSKVNLLIECQTEKGYNSSESADGSSYSSRPLTSVSVDKTQFLLADHSYTRMLDLLPTSAQTPTDARAVSQLIGQLLDDSKIDEACRVSVEYSYTTQDVVIILVGIGLAMKILNPQHLDSRVAAMLAEGRLLKRRSSSISQGYLLSVASADNLSTSFSNDTVGGDDECLNLLEKLSGKCRHGVMACDKIVCCYSIAQALRQPYSETVLESEYSLLKQLLSGQTANRYTLALDYINTCSLSDSDIASFLASHVYNTLIACNGLDSNHGFVVVSLEPASSLSAPSLEEYRSTGRECRHLIQLFTDQTVFGHSLLEQATNLTIDEPDVELKLAVKVELLILSHDAYTCAYDMEGISGVLRACRACAIQMNEISNYTLMIHMLIGIGRYSEMTYIFDTLKQNHQFELLFRKGKSKENKLKLAVLDYLRRFCPGDNDIYRVVSSHFAMYREIAQLLEQSALKKLGRLNITSVRNTDLFSASLSEIQKNLTDAAEIYIEGQCLWHAQKCVKQARLVCLQSSLLSAGIQVINLEAELVRSFIEHHDKFHDVFTVSEAYNKNFWAAALCKNVLLKGDSKYLGDFKKSLLLTTSLITEVVQRFQLRTDVFRNAQINGNLRRLLSNCKDVLVRYKLAQGLGLSDVANELLTADNGLSGAVIRDSHSSKKHLL